MQHEIYAAGPCENSEQAAKQLDFLFRLKDKVMGSIKKHRNIIKSADKALAVLTNSLAVSESELQEMQHESDGLPAPPLDSVC